MARVATGSLQLRPRVIVISAVIVTGDMMGVTVTPDLNTHGAAQCLVPGPDSLEVCGWWRGGDQAPWPRLGSQ